MRVAAAALVWLVAACGGDGPDQLVLSVDERTLALEVVAQRRGDDPNDTIALHLTRDLVGWRDTLLVVDGGNDRLVLFDTALAPIATIARSGSGPGELDSPFSIALTADGYIVGDGGNTRFLVYGRDGQLRGTRSAPRVPFSFGVGSGYELYIPKYQEEHYLVRVDSSGSAVPFAHLPGSERHVPSLENPPISMDHVAVTPGDTVHVLDNQTGRLLKYSPAGELVAFAALPGVSPSDVQEHMEELREVAPVLYAGGFAKK